MKIIYTCPRCGCDLIDLGICTNPPIGRKECPNCDWSHEVEPEETVRIPFRGNRGNNSVIAMSNIPSLNTDYDVFGNPSCLGCSNNPKNGGSGICHCILGLMEFTY